jgi:hypothetical protein
MAILFGGIPAVAEQWRKLLAEMLPTMEFRVWPEVGDPNDIEFVLWRHPAQRQGAVHHGGRGRPLRL